MNFRKIGACLLSAFLGAVLATGIISATRPHRHNLEPPHSVVESKQSPTTPDIFDLIASPTNSATIQTQKDTIAWQARQDAAWQSILDAQKRAAEDAKRNLASNADQRLRAAKEYKDWSYKQQVLSEMRRGNDIAERARQDAENREFYRQLWGPTHFEQWQAQRTQQQIADELRLLRLQQEPNRRLGIQY